MININDYKILVSLNINLFKNNFNGSGVYAAYGLVKSSKFLEPIYVGSAVNLKKRIIKEHISELKRNKHRHNKLLQRYYNDNGPENLIWILLEECSRDETLIKEQEWLDKLRPFADENRGFNFEKIVGKPFLGKTFSDEHKEKISKGNKGKVRTPEQRENISLGLTGIKFTQEHLDNLSKSHKGFKHTQESKDKMSESRKGEKNHFFGKCHSDITKKIISEKSIGREGYWTGKKIPKELIDKRMETFCKMWKFIDPNGVVVEIKNLSKFCRENNLGSSAMQRVAKGKVRMHKGWRKFEEDLIGVSCSVKQINFTKSGKLMSPAGEIIEFSNLSKFAKEHNLQNGNLSSLLNGRLNSHKGWTRVE